MEASPKSLKLFRSRSGSVPFSEWFLALQDLRAQQKIIARLARVCAGNLGRTNSVGEGVQEIKIDYGHFGQAGTDLVILLCGGDKQTQTEDIKKAKAYFAEYKKEKSHADY